MKEIKNLKKILQTPFEKLSNDFLWSDYPRPQMRRESYFCLNGKWSLKVINARDCEKQMSLAQLKQGAENKDEPLSEKIVFDGEINVPFPIPSRLSGVNINIKKNDLMVYKREFELNEDFIKDKLILHFGAVDQKCCVYINGMKVGENVGGYHPFSFDITKYYVQGRNTLEVRVMDTLDKNLPYGKQRKKRGGMWYTPICGIWQTVWLESVCENAIESLKIEMSTTSAIIEIKGGEASKTIIFEGKRIPFSGNKISLTPTNPETWTPDNPKLYDFTIESGRDRIESYFALRTIEIKNDKILLNGKPYFFNGLLDQGYFSDGIYLPASSEGYKFDIIIAKELGFNMLRKHIKIEPLLFYYYCDKYGMIVFQDMVNNGNYNFLFQTALPTIGMRKGNFGIKRKKQKANFEEAASKTVKLLYNNPSVCYYTIFNEGWGQCDAKNIYKNLKKMDNSRIWDATSGWFQTGESDVLSEHVYFKPVKLKKDKRPLVLSEFGGYSCEIDNHTFNPGKSYGYKMFKAANEFENALIKLYKNEIIPAIEDGLCATVLTQLSDVEDETNGIVTYDRQIIKIDRDKMKSLSEEINRVFFENINK